MTAFDTLLDGYRRFRKSTYRQQRERYDALAEGQAPKVMIVSCSDSRVSPSIVFDAGPGEIFMVRNVANLVPPFDPSGGLHGVSAALEFAVTQLEVEEVVVMGHGGCGGCAAALTHHFKGAEPGEGHFIASWIALLALEHEAVRVSLRNLTGFPFVRERMDAGSLTLRGAHFAIRDGVLHVMRPDGEFRPAAS